MSTVWGDRWTACCNDVMVIVFEDIVLYASDDCQTYRDSPPQIVWDAEQRRYESWYGLRCHVLRPLERKELDAMIEWAITGYETTAVALIGVIWPDANEVVYGDEALPYFYERL